jgi:quinoprotein glucose dehydrogenase
LIALDASTGKLVEQFGNKGVVSSAKSAGRSSFLGAVAPVIYRNVVIAPNQNIIEAFDVQSGAGLWSFNTLTYPVQESDEDSGGNVWGGVAIDESRGIIYAAIGDPRPNFVGISRRGDNKHTTSLVALNALTGTLLWSFQEIAHNVWDLDISAPPNLVTIRRGGKQVDAVAQVTKLGNTLLLDRLTGKPLFPYRLRRAPVSTVPGERTAPYQPDLELPQPFTRQKFSVEDVTTLSPESRGFILEKLKNASYGWFEPPRVDAPVIFYGVHGGAEWTGAAFDPSTGWLYVSANQIPWIESLNRIVLSNDEIGEHAVSSDEAVYQRHCAVCHGKQRQGKGMAPSLLGLSSRLSETDVSSIIKAGRNAMPSVSVSEEEKRHLLNFLFKEKSGRVDGEYGRRNSSKVSYVPSEFQRFEDEKGYPGSKPPWGTLNAIDLNSGKIVWKVPLGEYEELTRQGIPLTGTENFGGAMVTAGGLVFCAGTRDLKIRAFDKENGRELWQGKLPYGGYAPPATYMAHGRQYVVIAATGGGKLGGETGDAFVAFALPATQPVDGVNMDRVH